LALKRMRLADRRRAVGYSQEQLAGQLGIERSTVARWEHAETEPQPWIRPLLATALRVSPDDLDDLLAAVEVVTARRDGTAVASTATVPVRSGRDPVLSAPWTHRGTLDASVTLSGGEDSVRRRAFLYLTGAALTAPGHQWLDKEPAIARAVRSGGRVSAGLADRLPGVIAELRTMDDVAGGGNVLPFVRQGFGWIARLLDRTTHDDETGRKLHRALAELGHLAGWAGYDDEQHALAQRYYVAALRAAHDVDDRALGAHILGSMAHQAAHQGRPADAVTLIDTALTGVRGRATHALLAELHIRQAYAFATLGDAPATTAAISRALAHTERLGTEPEPPWLYWVRPGEITAGAGNCMLRLGRPERACPVLQDGIRTFGTSFDRDRGLYLARLAEAHARPGRQRDLEAAAHHATAAVEIAAGVSSGRSLTRIRELTGTMASHADVPAVRDFLERARAVLGI
jgi:transcriptional regulator with XRE-family HTH domain